MYWWNGMKKDMTNFVAKYMVCQQVKVKHLRLSRLTQEIELSVWKWKKINMYFVIGLPWSKNQFDSIWVFMDRMTKSAHFLLVRINYSTDDYAKLFL